jgi:hypothetical protein
LNATSSGANKSAAAAGIGWVWSSAAINAKAALATLTVLRARPKRLKVA